MLRSAQESSLFEPVPAPAAHGRAVDPIDRKHLSRYTFGDANLEYEVLGLFAGQMPETIRALKAAECDRDWQIAAHTLKGSGRAIGAWRLADLAHEAENIGRDEAATLLIIRQIEAAADDIARYIGALMQPGQAGGR